MRVAEVRAVRAGVLDLAFRRWERPRLRPGTRMRTAVGLVEVVSVDLVEPEAITDDDALRAGAASREELMSRLSAHPDRPVFRVVLRYAGPDPRDALRADEELSGEDREELSRRLDGFDRRARDGAWTRTTLDVIARRPARRAPDLAAELGRDPVAFKRDVRRLKELGLTESLEVGYRLSPRGRAFLEG
jgi:hypothetical protein